MAITESPRPGTGGVPMVDARRIACPQHVPFLTSAAAYEKYMEYWNSK
jgi:hypothetical protein